MYSVLEIHSHSYKEGLHCFSLVCAFLLGRRRKKAGGPGDLKDSGLDPWGEIGRGYCHYYVLDPICTDRETKWQNSPLPLPYQQGFVGNNEEYVY